MIRLNNVPVRLTVFDEILTKNNAQIIEQAYFEEGRVTGYRAYFSKDRPFGFLGELDPRGAYIEMLIDNHLVTFRGSYVDVEFNIKRVHRRCIEMISCRRG